jgi:hypothetical protein
MDQSLDLLSHAELRLCLHAVNGTSWAAEVRSSPLVIVSYVTRLPANAAWELGLTAAAKRIPLLLAGLGRRWKNTAETKSAGIRRAAQLLHALAPHTAVAVVDAPDTAVVNQLSNRTLKALHSLGSSVLVGAECHSFPRCYRDELNATARGATCLQRAQSAPRACFLSGGGWVARSRTVVSVTTLMLRYVADGQSWDARIGSDQALLHRLHFDGLSSAHQDSSASIRVDELSEVFLTIAKCNSDYPAPEIALTLPELRGRSTCNGPRYDALPRTHWDGNGLSFSFEDEAGRVRTQHPLIAHWPGPDVVSAAKHIL